MAHAFGTVGHACAISVKSVRRKAKHTHYNERAQECERVFEPHRTQRYGGFFQDSHLKEYHNTQQCMMCTYEDSVDNLCSLLQRLLLFCGYNYIENCLVGFSFI